MELGLRDHVGRNWNMNTFQRRNNALCSIFSFKSDKERHEPITLIFFKDMALRYSGSYRQRNIMKNQIKCIWAVHLKRELVKWSGVQGLSFPPGRCQLQLEKGVQAANVLLLFARTERGACYPSSLSPFKCDYFQMIATITFTFGNKITTHHKRYMCSFRIIEEEGRERVLEDSVRKGYVLRA